MKSLKIYKWNLLKQLLPHANFCDIWTFYREDRASDTRKCAENTQKWNFCPLWRHNSEFFHIFLGSDFKCNKVWTFFLPFFEIWSTNGALYGMIFSDITWLWRHQWRHTKIEFKKVPTGFRKRVMSPFRKCIENKG